MSRKKNLVLFLAILFAAALGISRAFSEEKYFDQMRTFTSILDHVMRYYVTELDEQKVNELFEGAYNGLLGRLDPYTQYMNTIETKTFSEDTEGKFGGLGIEISVKDGLLTVIAPIRGTPAYEAGILAGDVILKIDGRSTERLPLQEAVKILRGKPNTKVTLTVRHQGSPVDEEITITRAVIKPASVEYGIIDSENGIGLMRVVSFSAHVMEDFRSGIAEMRKDGLRALVLDLRGNPGGLLDRAVAMCDEFIADGVIVSVRGRQKERDQSFSARPGDELERMPLVVLVDGGSASASEIVAGCLRDHRRAVLVGTPTYGKGSVQNIIPLGDGAALKLTTARYYTPNDKPIEDRHGIVPDILVPMTREHLIALRNQEREDKLRNRYHLGSNLEEGEEAEPPAEAEGEEGPSTPRRGRVIDFQLRAAVNLLKWRLAPGAAE